MADTPSGPRALARRLALSVPPLRRLVEDRRDLRRRQHRLERRMADQRRRIRHLEQHLRELQALAGSGDWGAGEPAPKLGYLFVVSYGRSGSTLLQGLLNTIPGYLIRGENRAAVYRLYQFHSALLDARADFSRIHDLSARESWYGIDEYADAAALSRMRALVLQTLLHPEPDTRVIGFKEIRWWQNDWQRYLGFLRELFPGARFVINTRNLQAVAKSQWWAKLPERQALDQLAGYERRLDEMAGYLGADVYRVHYDDYVADRSSLAGLFAWLGEPFDRAAIDSVLDVRHSF